MNDVVCVCVKQPFYFPGPAIENAQPPKTFLPQTAQALKVTVKDSLIEIVN